MTSVADYMTGVMPRFLSGSVGFRAMTGTLCFVIGPHAWTVTLGDIAEPVRLGATRDADLVLSLSEDAAAELFSGELDIERALARDVVGYRGDLRLLERFGRLLEGLQSAVDLRSGGGG